MAQPQAALESDVIQGEPRTQAEANQIIVEIQGRKGYLSKPLLDWLEHQPETFRREITRKFDACRNDSRKLIKSTTTLNSSDGHFIHELLQNADDAKYKRATSLGVEPRIKFYLTSEHLVVETNEDGFTRADVEAICQAGESSKKKNENERHIGEKGIGFKSIFRIAEQVHISSGFWHFQFKHDEEDSLSMVTPLLDKPTHLPDEVGTRLTLKFQQRYRQNLQPIVKELRAVPDTIIFFLRNLTSLEIALDIASARDVTTITNSWYSKPHLKEVATSSRRTSVNASQDATSNKKLYGVFSSPSLKMPRDRRRPLNQAVVELAFPLDRDGTKCAIDSRGQHVFAFLPMYRKIQLPFMIQSDFITADNRESTTDCDWNDQLLHATAHTFCSAIAMFCERGILIYDWLRFVPTLPIDGFWEPLQSLIIGRICEHQVLRSFTSRTMKRPHAVFRIPEKFRYLGKPLLADRTGPEEIYLATEYDAHYDLLAQLRIKEIGWAQAFDRLSDDLTSSDSKIKSGLTPVGWHEAFAAWLLDLWANADHFSYCDKLKRIPIVPLTSGIWRAVSGSSLQNSPPLYLPTINGIAIPQNLGFDLVQNRASSMRQRVLLFRRLGVRDCNAQDVIREVKKWHMPPYKKWMTGVDLVDHLYFLYQTSSNIQGTFKDFRILDATCNVASSSSEIYVESDQPYSTHWLLHQMSDIDSTISLKRTEWLLHSLYFEKTRTSRSQDKMTWKNWLVKEIGIREYPALTRTNASSELQLSRFFEAVLATSSNLFLSTLQARWYNDFQIGFNESICQLLKNCEVLCQDGKRHRLADTYLPCNEVVQRAKQLNVPTSSRILSLDLKGQDFVLRDWSFLTDMGARIAVDIEFHLEALRTLQLDTKAVIAYDYIGENAQKKQSQYLKSSFRNQKILYCPTSTPSQWMTSDDCVWTGPSFLTVRKPLAIHYQNNVNASYLFKTLLEIRDVTWSDLVDQLRDIKQKSNGDGVRDRVATVYAELGAMKIGAWREVRDLFNQQKLVYISGSWYGLDNCLWTSPAKIEGRPILANVYPQLESFFTKDLGIRRASAGHLLAELIRKAKAPNRLGLTETKSFMKQISRMLAFESEDMWPGKLIDDLAQTDFLPIRKGTEPPQLVDCSADFAIRDDLAYSQAFAETCTFLDFSFEEIPQVSKLLKALPLNTKFLSYLVKERPTVGDDASLDPKMTDEFHQKAPCLLSCAYQYHSPLATETDLSLFQELRSLQVFTCSTISTQLVLELGGVEITGVSKEAQVLRQVRNGKTCLFVPSCSKARKSCFRSKLPTEMLRLMKIEYQEGAQMSVMLVLGEALSEMEDIMKTQNLACVPWLDRRLYTFASAEGGNANQVNYVHIPKAAPLDGRASMSASRTVPNGGTTGTSPASLSNTHVSTPNSDFTQPATPRSNLEPNRASSSTFRPDLSARSDSSSPADPFSLPRSGQQFFNFDSGQAASLNSPPNKLPGSHTDSFSFDGDRSFRFSTNAGNPFGSTFKVTRNLGTEKQGSAPFVFGSGLFGSSISSATRQAIPSTSQPPASLQQHKDYKDLLDRIIKCARGNQPQSHGEEARRASDIGDSSAFGNLSALGAALPSAPIDLTVEAVFGTVGNGQHFKIGAAGELFVFERLRQLHLPNFGTDNWRSRIRHHVNVHSEYKNLTTWGSAETADIVYEDSTGQMKDWLRKVSCNGFPDFPSSGVFTSGFECKYYIEVKSTVSPQCDAPFYMSDNEYRLMCESKTQTDRDPNAIYVFVRVFNITKEEIAFKVFVDPVRSRDDGKSSVDTPTLRFEVDRWKITPRTGSVLACH